MLDLLGIKRLQETLGSDEMAEEGTTHSNQYIDNKQLSKL